MNDKQKLFNTLPRETQLRIVDYLLYFDEIHLTLEYGQYQINVDMVLKTKYPDDYKYIGSFKFEDIYPTYQERQNIRVERENFFKTITYEELENYYKSLN